MKMPNGITSDTPPHEIIADLRRACILRRFVVEPSINFDKDNAAARLNAELANAHVFDFGYMLCPDETDSLGDSCHLLLNEGVNIWHEHGLSLPFGTCVFLYRHRCGNTAVVHVSVFMQSEPSIALVYFVHDRRQWIVFGSSRLPRHNPDNVTYGGFGVDGKDAKLVVQDVVVCLALLYRRGPEVEVDVEPVVPSSVALPAKMKSFERPPASVSVVKVNKLRVIHPASDEEVGDKPRVPSTPKRPHDRRGTYVHYKSGKVGWRRPAKIHRGADARAVRKVELDAVIKPLDGVTN
jgi:hypothetical protein